MHQLDGELRCLLLQVLLQGNTEFLDQCYILPSCKTLVSFRKVCKKNGVILSTDICTGHAQLNIIKRSKVQGKGLVSLASTWGFCETAAQAALQSRLAGPHCNEEIAKLADRATKLRQTLSINTEDPTYNEEYREGATSALKGSCFESEGEAEAPQIPPTQSTALSLLSSLIRSRVAGGSEARSFETGGPGTNDESVALSGVAEVMEESISAAPQSSIEGTVAHVPRKGFAKMRKLFGPRHEALTVSTQSDATSSET